MDPVVFQLGFIGLNRLAMVRNCPVVEARTPPCAKATKLDLDL